MVMYFDVETTGLDPVKNGIIEFAAIFEEGGKEVERFHIKINPSTYDKPVGIDEVALKVNKTSLSDLARYPHSKDGFQKLLSALNRISGTSKMIPVGYNSGNFDIPFLKAWFEDNGEDYGNWFHYKDIDVFALVKVLKYFKKFQTKDDKLETVCKHFGIEIDAHNAMSDIEATRELFKVLEDKYLV